MVETEFTLTQREMTSAVRLSGLTAVFRLRTLFWMAVLIAGIMLTIFILTRFDLRPRPALEFILGFFVLYAVYVLFGAVLYWVLWPLGARAQMRNSKDLSNPIQCRGDDAGWHVRTISAASDSRWETYTKWSENSDMLLIYMNSTIFQMIPKCALRGAHDLHQIRAWLVQAGVPRVAPLR